MFHFVHAAINLYHIYSTFTTRQVSTMHSATTAFFLSFSLSFVPCFPVCMFCTPGVWLWIPVAFHSASARRTMHARTNQLDRHVVLCQISHAVFLPRLPLSLNCDCLHGRRHTARYHYTGAWRGDGELLSYRMPWMRLAVGYNNWSFVFVGSASCLFARFLAFSLSRLPRLLFDFHLLG